MRVRIVLVAVLGEGDNLAAERKVEDVSRQL